VPTLPGRLQASHAPPLQVVLQHTPSTQLPLPHSLAAPQVSPLAFTSVQAPALQKWPAVHWESVEQVVGQEAPPPHTNGAQEGAPTPPAATAVQVPSRPGWLQVSQAPAQAVSQQTPSAHEPLPHWLPASQAAPGLSCSTQLPVAPQK
jgi:hypothetical protein